jgi:hypothetical protein
VQQPGVSEGDERGRLVGLGLDELGQIGPTGGGVFVVGEQHVTVGRARGGDPDDGSCEAAERLRQLGAGVEHEEGLERDA